MGESKLLEAVFTAVCALAKKLTGERMTIFVENTDGQRVAIIGDSVRWAVPLDCCDPRPEPRSMLGMPLTSHGATERAPVELPQL